MSKALADRFRHLTASLDPADPEYATQVVDLLLAEARAASVSDIHLQPSAEGLEIRWRIDGVLQAIGTLPKSVAPNVVARLKVLAELLTYQTDRPQEGRLRAEPGAVETRVSTMPTLQGEKAVVRLFAGQGRFLRLDDLDFSDESIATLRRSLVETAGMIVLAGPAGSGKTTSLYACLRELAESSAGARSLVTLEDPIEVAVPGVSQSQVRPQAGFTLESGLRSLLRQDPEVIAVGEIRDASTAAVAFQAALTGHLVLPTFHAGSAAGAIGRLSDMGIEPYLLRSGLLAILSQRLARRLCETCSRPIDLHSEPDARLGLDVDRAWKAVGCEACRGTGYLSRFPLVELLVPGAGDLGRALFARNDVARIEELASKAGMISRWDRARQAIEAGRTTTEEVRRVLGFSVRKPDEGSAPKT
ncbi:type II secretion system ATPase GspE [soil metagenome]